MRNAVLPTMMALLLSGMCLAQDGTTMQIRPHLPPADQIAPLADMSGQPSAEELKARAEVREYRRQIRKVRYEFLGRKKNEKLRAEGIERLKEFTDPASFVPLIEELSDEQDDVKLALLEHFEDQGEWGQAALAWIVIHNHEDQAWHYEALKRLTTPVGDPTLNVIDHGLRSEDDFVANLSGRLAGHLNLHQTIPLLIHGQSRTRPIQEPGDDAWILVGKQRAFVRALIPIIGDGSGAFLPVPGVLTEGVILRVVEAVAVIYRTEIHRTLVAMTTQDWGESTAHLGYDKHAWRAWYENEYVPYKQEQALARKLAEEEPQKIREDSEEQGQTGGGGS